MKTRIFANVSFRSLCVIQSSMNTFLIKFNTDVTLSPARNSKLLAFVGTRYLLWLFFYFIRRSKFFTQTKPDFLLLFFLCISVSFKVTFLTWFSPTIFSMYFSFFQSHLFSDNKVDFFNDFTQSSSSFFSMSIPVTAPKYSLELQIYLQGFWPYNLSDIT